MTERPKETISSLHKVVVEHRPITDQCVRFLITRKQIEQAFASKQLARSLIQHNWVEVVRPGGPGREALYSYASAVRAFERIKAGEWPGENSAEIAQTKGLGKND